MSFEEFLNVFKSIDGIKIIESKDGPHFVTYSVITEGVHNEIQKAIGEIKNDFASDISLQSLEEGVFRISFGSIELDSNIKSLSEKLISLTNKQEEERKIKYNELGVPDLSLVTIKQMVEELKKRKNLVFSLVWIENNERDNIAIEGSGNPTQLVGLLARGVHMAIEWADRSIRFNK